MSVAEARETIALDEFSDWMYWFEHRAQLAQCQRDGRPMPDEPVDDEDGQAAYDAMLARMDARLARLDAAHRNRGRN